MTSPGATESCHSMKLQRAARLNGYLKLGARIVSVMVMLFGGLALLGWTLRVAAPHNAFRGLTAMVPDTAFALVLAGFSLWVLRSETSGTAARAAARTCALVVALAGALAICEYVFGRDLGMDRLLFGKTLADLQTPIAGRPAILTAVNFLLLGLALLFLDTNGRHGHRLVEVLTVAAILVSLLALIGHICNVPFFYGWSSLFPGTAMGLPSVLAFTALGLGLLCARPDRGLVEVVTSDTAGGLMARRLLLAPVFIPLATGWLKLAGQRLHIYNAEFAAWLFAYLNIFVFTVIIWRNAGLLYRAELGRRRAASDG